MDREAIEAMRNDIERSVPCNCRYAYCENPPEPRDQRELNEEIRQVEEKIRKSPPKGYKIKKSRYLIEVGAKLFEVGMIFSVGHLSGPCLFIGLIEHDSLTSHLGFYFKVKSAGKGFNYDLS